MYFFRLAIFFPIQDVFYEVRQYESAALDAFVVVFRREGARTVRFPCQGIVFLRAHSKAVHARRIQGNEGRVQARNGEDIGHAVLDFPHELAVHKGRFRLLYKQAVFLQCLKGVFIEFIRKQAFAGADRIGAVDDDDVVEILRFAHEGNAVADLDGQLRIVFPHGFGNRREKLLRQLNDLAVDVDHRDVFYFGMAHGFTSCAAVAAADDEDVFRIGMQKQRDMGNAFVINKLVLVRRLEHAVQHEHTAEFLRIGYDNILKIRFAFI